MLSFKKSLFVGITLVLAGCASPGPPLPTDGSNAYLLGPGDKVRVITAGDAGVPPTFEVSDSGTISFPMLGNIKASGLTPEQLGSEIQNDLVAKQMLTDPSISAEIVSYRPVFVLGEVTKPGQYTYEPGMTVDQAVAMAGGYTYRAVTDYVDVTRQVGHTGNHLKGSATPDELLRPGDVVKVEERSF